MNAYQDNAQKHGILDDEYKIRRRSYTLIKVEKVNELLK